MLPVVTKNVEQTVSLGEQVGRTLQAGSIVALSGELGSGKTHFAKGICSAFGVDPDQVQSPTFTIVHEYRAGSLPVYHFDAYRIERVEEFFDLGFEEYFFGEGISIIEWPERIASLLPIETIVLHLQHAGASARRVSLIQTSL